MRATVAWIYVVLRAAVALPFALPLGAFFAALQGVLGMLAGKPYSDFQFVRESWNKLWDWILKPVRPPSAVHASGTPPK